MISKSINLILNHFMYLHLEILNFCYKILNANRKIFPHLLIY